MKVRGKLKAKEEILSLEVVGNKIYAGQLKGHLNCWDKVTLKERKNKVLKLPESIWSLKGYRDKYLFCGMSGGYMSVVDSVENYQVFRSRMGTSRVIYQFSMTNVVDELAVGSNLGMQFYKLEEDDQQLKNVILQDEHHIDGQQINNFIEYEKNKYVCGGNWKWFHLNRETSECETMKINERMCNNDCIHPLYGKTDPINICNDENIEYLGHLRYVDLDTKETSLMTSGFRDIRLC
jgi:hypothetical protein